VPHPLSASALSLVLLAHLSALGASEMDSRPRSLENSLGMNLVLVPPGEFLMGSDETPESLAKAYSQYQHRRFVALSDEAPVHRVRITRPFYLGQYEVTVGQFRKFLEASGYVPESIADGTGGYGYNPAYDPARSARGDAFEGRDPKYSWRNPGFPQGDHHPVLNATWNDAVALATWLTAREGVTYRLPTEAEWEYACRAGTRTRYASGDDPESLLEVANTFAADAKAYWSRWEAYALGGRDGFAFTAPVGRFMPNAWGLYDLHGNAWEWVSDWHANDYYAQIAGQRPSRSGDGRQARAPRRLLAHLGALCPLRLPQLGHAQIPLHAGRHPTVARGGAERDRAISRATLDR
jgi:formylglycine-generating enzyme required for sulfatase activity